MGRGGERYLRVEDDEQNNERRRTKDDAHSRERGQPEKEPEP